MDTSTETIKVVPPGEGKSFWLLGDLITYKAVGEETNSGFSLLEITVQPESSGPPQHWHREEVEGLYLLEGELLIESGEKSFTATPGSFVLAPKGIPHTYRNLTTSPAKMLAIITPANAGEFFEKAGVPATNKFTPPPPPEPEKIEELIAIAQQHNIEINLPQMV
ncbi:cupin domain-containing protein [Aerosakkonema funiforme]|uniref:Cupin domain-containing protein n=2 Tax=Oscillatoriophycideae TaxID=1301283 RepID=A0A926ZGK8_9CYAN|nr:cupin domain-containing protein [Aerosakkonema funiforme]MBD2182105.1 cupin domain-containing protein [Aerosakkonema funiforme FACHB-1375]